MKTKRNWVPLVAASVAVGGTLLYAAHAGSSSALGWYWAFIEQTPEAKAQWAAFQLANKGKIRVTKTATPHDNPGWDIFFNDDPNKPLPAWILFQKLAPFEWTLPGKPVAAPKGEATQMTDIVGDEQNVPAWTSPEHPWNKFWGVDTNEVKSPIGNILGSLGTVGSMVVWGGGAMILMELWSLLRTVDAPARAARQLGAGS